MKKIFLFLFTLAIGITTLYANPKHEFRASWMTTGYGLDWPRNKTIDAQKAELQQKLDALVVGNHNALTARRKQVACQAKRRLTNGVNIHSIRTCPYDSAQTARSKG